MSLGRFGNYGDDSVSNVSIADILKTQPQASSAIYAPTTAQRAASATAENAAVSVSTALAPRAVAPRTSAPATHSSLPSPQKILLIVGVLVAAYFAAKMLSKKGLVAANPRRIPQKTRGGFTMMPNEVLDESYKADLKWKKSHKNLEKQDEDKFWREFEKQHSATRKKLLAAWKKGLNIKTNPYDGPEDDEDPDTLWDDEDE